MSYIVAWFVTFLILLFIEIITVDLVTIWFAIGALAAMGTSFLTDSVIVQVLCFVAVSIFTLLITRPIVKKFKGFNITPTNSDRVIGKIGEVTKKIEKNQYGEVKIFGNIWTAFGNEDIAVGSKVKVLGIDGVKLVVEKEED